TKVPRAQSKPRPNPRRLKPGSRRSSPDCVPREGHPANSTPSVSIFAILKPAPRYLPTERPPGVTRAAQGDEKLVHTTFGRSGKTAPQGSLSLRACLRAQLAVTCSVNANTFSFRPYRISTSASRYRPERPHFEHSIRSRSSL